MGTAVPMQRIKKALFDGCCFLCSLSIFPSFVYRQDGHELSYEITRIITTFAKKVKQKQKFPVPILCSRVYNEENQGNEEIK